VLDGRKAPNKGAQDAVLQRGRLLTVEVLSDEAAVLAKDNIRREKVRLRNLANISTRRFEHERTARGHDASTSTVAAPHDERGKLPPSLRGVLCEVAQLRL
jgi:hypothetical protein